MIAETAHARLFHRPGRTGFAVVHFGSETATGGREDPLARLFAAAPDLDLFLVEPRRPTWYPAAAMQAICTAIAERNVKPALACGASMGGYGALRHGAAAGCAAVLAFSPQAHIDPRRTGVEGAVFTRHFRPGLHREMAVQAAHLPERVLVVADPADTYDRLQAEVLRQLPTVRIVPLGSMGHRTDRAVQTTARAMGVAAAVLGGTRAQTSALLRRGCRGLPDHLAHLSLACADHGHLAWAEVLATRACARSPSVAALMARAAVRIGAGRPVLALRDLEAVALANPRDPLGWTHLVRLYDHLGRPHEADQVLRIAIAETGSFGLCWRLFGRLRDRQETAAARAVARVAAAHWPRMRPVVRHGLDGLREHRRG